MTKNLLRKKRVFNQNSRILKEKLGLLQLPEKSAASNFHQSHQYPQDLDFDGDDAAARDHILAAYVVDVINFGAFSCFNDQQLSMWATIFLQSHQGYISELSSCSYGPETTRSTLLVTCVKVFRKVLYDKCFDGRNLFQPHQIRSLVDFFFKNYVQHINLITNVFCIRQSRLQFSATLPLSHLHECTSLDQGILEENWEEYLQKEQEEADRVKNEMREKVEAERAFDLEKENQQDRELTEAKNEPPSPGMTAYCISCSLVSLLLAPFPEFANGSITENVGMLIPKTAVKDLEYDESIPFDMNSIKSLLDSITPLISSMGEKLETRISGQVSEMNDRMDILKIHLESKRQRVDSAGKNSKKK